MIQPRERAVAPSCRQLAEHERCNANDQHKARALSKMQITTDISPVQFWSSGEPKICEGPLITAQRGAAAAGWLLMNPHWQTFSGPKNTVMSSHSATWSQLRLPSASVVPAQSSWALYGRRLISWGYGERAGVTLSRACVREHVGKR